MISRSRSKASEIAARNDVEGRPSFDVRKAAIRRSRLACRGRPSSKPTFDCASGRLQVEIDPGSSMTPIGLTHEADTGGSESRRITMFDADLASAVVAEIVGIVDALTPPRANVR